MEISAKTEKVLFLSALPGVGAKTILSLRKIEDQVISTAIDELPNFLPSLKKKIGLDDIERAKDFAKKNIEIANQLNHRIITLFDSEYPALLQGIPDAPALLFCSGNIEALKTKSLAIIGTREPTPHGERIAERLTYWFTQRGWTIVSGLAKGIDSISHRACIDTGGKTAAVLAHGLEKIYPAENKKLAQDIINNGGILISEYAYNSPTFKTNFVQRDRVQAALSAAVALVQTDVTGGSLHASKAALKYERNLIVVGQSKFDIATQALKAQGNIRLLEEGERAFPDLFNDSKLNGNLMIKLFDKNNLEYAEEQIIKNINLKFNMEHPQEERKVSTLI